MSQLAIRSAKLKSLMPSLNTTAWRMSSSYEPTYDVKNPTANKYGWRSWRDIPDSMIPTTSKRDPDNGIYATRKYINLRKKQIWFQLRPDVPMYLRNGLSDKLLFYVILIAIVLDSIFVGNELRKMLYPPKRKIE